MVYDAENRQISYTKAGVTTTYSYDGDGRRVKKFDSTGTIIFVYNAGGQLIAEYHSDPVPPPAGGGGTSYLTSDHLGSTRVVTKSDGTVKARYDYLPFGEELGAGVGQRTTGMGYSVADSTRQKFTQKERDSESGLDYFGSRYYSSPQGRFTSVDPVKLTPARMLDPQRFNLYAYVRDNPLKFIDPKGEDGFLANEDKEGRGKALLKITVNLSTAEQKNIGYRLNASGKYELYVKDPSKTDMSKASAGYKYLTNLIGNHDLNVNFTLIGKGGSAPISFGGIQGRVTHQELVKNWGGGLVSPDESGKNLDVYAAEGGYPKGVIGLTKSGKETTIAEPDFMITAHELLGETYKYTPEGTKAGLQENVVNDSNKVIDIENEIRQFHGLPMRSYRGHIDLGEPVQVRPKE